jgi:ATP-dependent Clp protease protease subunit
MIYDTMQYIKADVQTICMGMAASMVRVPSWQAGTPGKRFALQTRKIMIHQPSGGAQGQATDIHIAAEHNLKCKQRFE